MVMLFQLSRVICEMQGNNYVLDMFVYNTYNSRKCSAILLFQSYYRILLFVL